MTEVEKRIFVDAYKKTRQNNEYESYVNKIIMLRKKIMEQLGDHRLLFLEYEGLIDLSDSIYMESIYYIGLEDGQKNISQ